MESMKDVVSCDKPRVSANYFKSGDFRMGQPGAGHAASSTGEYIACAKQTRGTEPSKYPLEEKATAIFLVAASERETA